MRYRITFLWRTLLPLLAFACDCSQPYPLPPELPSLTDIRITGPIAVALDDSKHTLPGADHVQSEDMDIVLRLYDDVDNPATRQAAADTLYSLWADAPRNLLYMDFAITRSRILERDEALSAMLALPALADTTTLAGRFAHARLGLQQPGRRAHFIKCWDMASDLPPLQRIWLLLKVVDTHRRAGRYLQALAMLVDQLPAAREVGGPVLEGYLWRRISLQLRHLGRLDEAVHANSHAIRLAEFSPYGYSRCRYRYELAVLYSERGETDKALSLFQSAYDLSLDYNLAYSRIFVMNRLSSLYIDLGEVSSALRYDLLSAQFAAECSDTVKVMRSYLNVADDHVKLGDLDSAWNAIRIAKQWAEPYSDGKIRWAVYLEEADYRLIKGDYAEADSLRRLATGINPHTDADTDVEGDKALQLLRVVQQAREMGRIESAFTALLHLEKLVDSNRTKLPGVDFRFEAAIEMASLRTETGEFDLAEDRLTVAEERLTLASSHEKSVRFHQAKGLLLTEAGAPDNALAEFRLALEMALAGGNANTISRLRLVLASQLLLLNRPDEAAKHIETVDRHLDHNTAYRTWQLKRLLMGRMNSALGHHAQAVEIFAETLAAAGNVLSRDLAIRFHIETGISLVHLDKPTAAHEQFILAERLLDQAQTITRTSETRLILGDSIRDCYTNWTELLLDNPHAFPDEDIIRKTLQLRLNLIALEQGRSHSDHLPYFPSPTLVTLLTKGKTVLWLVSDETVALTELDSPQEILADARSLHHCLTNPERPWRTDVAERLSARLLSNLAGKWPPGTPLYMISDSGLRGLPWAALPWADGQILDHAPVIEYQPTRQSSLDSNTEAATALLAVGFNGYPDNSIRVLQHARDEAEAIAGNWPTHKTCLLDHEAARLSDMLPSRRWGAIHLALHALMNHGISDRSHLVLPGDNWSNKLLGCREIGDMRIDSELVFLSCCETSAGVISTSRAGLDLAGAFLQAGVRNVITSSHKVSDDAASAIASRFYKHWLAGMTMPAALQTSCRELRDEIPGRKHPSFWATWRLRAACPASP
ncbi:MAG: CHAT domain-containing protein [bacterium]|nr:CHAT domain-containing protein [bacterium]